MLPLSRQIGTNLSKLAWIVAARSFGYIVTTIIFGIILQSIIKTNSELILSIGFLFPAAGLFFDLK